MSKKCARKGCGHPRLQGQLYCYSCQLSTSSDTFDDIPAMKLEDRAAIDEAIMARAAHLFPLLQKDH